MPSNLRHMTHEEAKDLLARYNVRATQARIAVIRGLSMCETPVSFTELVAKLPQGKWDPATIFRNLVKLADIGVLDGLNQVGGVVRYALNRPNHSAAHRHPHFLCQSCGDISCLPVEVGFNVPVKWREAVQKAQVQLSGVCPSCDKTKKTN